MVDKDTPCNIVASRDGIIQEMVVLEGQAVVKVGDTVKKGQLLVSGLFEDSDTLTSRFVHAMAQVKARTWYEGIGVCSLNKNFTRRTGRKAVHKFIDLGKWVVEYHREEIPFKQYEVEEKRVPFFGEGRFFPATMIVREYYEVEEVPKDAALQSVKQVAQKMAMDDVNKKIPSNAKVVDKQIKYDIIESEGIKAIVYVEVLEDIAQQQKITVE
jgi:similar to stage IV sporulation protein